MVVTDLGVVVMVADVDVVVVVTDVEGCAVVITADISVVVIVVLGAAVICPPVVRLPIARLVFRRVEVLSIFVVVSIIDILIGMLFL